jgi:hypothetical protein
MYIRQDGHEYREKNGVIFDSAGETVGRVFIDVAEEFWIIEDAYGEYLGQIHANVDESRMKAIQIVIASLS